MTTEELINEIITENRNRYNKLLAAYDPVSGKDAPGERMILYIEDHPIQQQYIPVEMAKNKLVKKLIKYASIKLFLESEKKKIGYGYTEENYESIIKELSIVRNRYDFCYWAYICVKIKPKEGGEMIPFKLNYAQIILLCLFESKRTLSEPIRIILLKARQWGGSTFIQIYMSWIQLCHKKAWYSTIVAQTQNTASRILEMYSKLIDNYPPWAIDLDEREHLKLSSYGKLGRNDYTIKDSHDNSINDTVIQVGSVIEPDNIRGGDVAMIHYSEVGVWKDTPGRRPEDMIRSLTAGLMYRPYTIEALESTAKGTGNYFHREWSRAVKGESNRTPVFIPWYYILNDTVPLDDERAMAEWLLSCCNLTKEPEGGWLDEGRYYWWLWELGATLEGINWYRIARKSYQLHSDLQGDAPSDPVEAFQNSGKPIFDIYQINELRKKCADNYMIGEIESISGEVVGGKCLNDVHFEKDDKGNLKIWSMVEKTASVTNRYLVVVDIGGRWKEADYSVITVFDRFAMSIGGKPEIAAEWRGHIDHDKLAWKAAMISKFYFNALLVIESNTLETKDKNRDTDGNDVEYILDILSQAYSNLYARERSSESIDQRSNTKWGFHTNTQTKPAIIAHMVACLRDKAWVERSNIACDEMSFYEKKENGSFGAADGQKDDMVMTRAIGLWICYRVMDMPVQIRTSGKREHKIYNEANF